MPDDELKRLLKGLFSDEPIEVAPNEAPPDEPPLAHPRDRQEVTSEMPKHEGSDPGLSGRDLRMAEVDRSRPIGPGPSQGLIRRLWASSQAISAASDAGQIGQALMQFAAQAGVDVARLLMFVEEVDDGPGQIPARRTGTGDRDGSPTTLEMCDGWTVDNRPAQPCGTRLPLDSYPLLQFMRADQPVVVEDISTDLRANETVRTFMAISGVGSFFIVPLCAGPASSEGPAVTSGTGDLREASGTGQKWLGALFMGRNGPSVFAGDLIEISWTLAAQAAVVLQYLERMEELEKTLRTLAQRDVEQSALIDNIPDGIYFKDAESRFTRINTYQANVLLGSSDTGAAVGKTDWDFYAAEFAEQAWNDERQIIESKQPLIGRIEKTVRGRDGEERWVSATKIPLTDDKGEVTGLVGISRDITDLKVAQEQAQHRATEMQLAAEISKVATGLLDPDQLMQQAVRLIADRFDLYYAGLFLVDDAGEWVVLRAGTGEAGRSMIQAGHRLKVGGRSMIGQCVANARAGIALDVGAEPSHFDNPLLPDTRSELALPLVSHGRAIGALTIQSTAEAAFSEEDVTALQTMADQLANAVDNARLFQERERRIQELATVSEIGQIVASTLDLETLFETVHREVSRLFDVNSFYIATYEEGSDEWESAFRLERGERQPRARRSIQGGVTGYIIRTRQPLLFGTRQEYLDFVEAHDLTPIGEPTVSWLGAPLIAADRCVGVMCVQNYDRENLYSDSDLAILNTIAGQVASALENARLFQDMQQRTIEFQALYDVALSLSTQMERQELLRLIVEQAVALLDAEAGGFYLYDARAGELIFSVATGYFADFIGSHLKPGEGLAGQVFQSRRSQVVSDYHSWTSRAGVYDQEARLHNLLGVPVAGRAGVLGVLDIAGGKQMAAFSPQDVRMAELFAAQAAVALENLQLLEDSRQRAAELAVLNDMGRALSHVLTIDTVVDSIHHYVSQLMDATNFYLALYDAEKDEISFPLYIDGERVRRDVAGRLSGKGMTEHIIRTKQPLLVKDNLDVLLAELGVESIGQDARSWLGVPLIIGEQPIGVITVQSYTTPWVYDEHARDLLTAVASQSAIAIQNARLFEQTQAALAETEARARRERIGREITANVRASIDSDAIMQAAVRDLGTALGRPAFVRIGNAEQLLGPPGESPVPHTAGGPAPAVVDDKTPRDSLRSQTDRSGSRGGRRGGRRGGK